MAAPVGQIEGVGGREADGARRNANAPGDRQGTSAVWAEKSGPMIRRHDQEAEDKQHARGGHRTRHDDAERSGRKRNPRSDVAIRARPRRLRLARDRKKRTSRKPAETRRSTAVERGELRDVRGPDRQGCCHSRIVLTCSAPWGERSTTRWSPPSPRRRGCRRTPRWLTKRARPRVSVSSAAPTPVNSSA